MSENETRLKKGFGLGGRFDRALHVEVASTFAFGTDEYWMEQALITSMNAVGFSPPNPSVGCVLVKNNEVLARGFTQETGKEHAERMAFLPLPPDTDFSEVTAYVTLEPCSHFGLQPPCADLFIGTKIKRVVVACQDSDSRVDGKGVARLRADGIEVTTGVLAAEVRAFLLPFFHQAVTNTPLWVAKWAQTPMGYLADANGHSKWITNEKSRAYTHWLRQKYDVIVVGAETYRKDRPKLDVRNSALPHHRNPVPVIFDPNGVLLGESIPSHFRHAVGESALTQMNSQILQISAWNTEEALFRNFKAAVNAMEMPKKLQSVMVEGGPSLLRGLFNYSLVDAAHQFVGTREFDTQDERYRIQWKPSKNFSHSAEENFDQDCLRERWKGF